MPELCDKTANNKYDVIGITETWATPAINDAELSLEGYSIFRKDRNGLKGGGLILYVSHKIRACINKNLTNSNFEESLWRNLELQQKRLLVGLCYRSPSSNVDNETQLLDLMDKAADRTGNDHVVILGDFNYPQIDYVNENVTARDDDSATLYFNKTQDLCLYQHVHKPTRFRQHQTLSTLDYVFTDENLIDTIQYNSPLGKSDHVVLSWDLRLGSPELPSVQIKYNYFKGNYAKIQSCLQCVNWHERWKDKSVNYMWGDFVQLFQEQVAHSPIMDH